MLFEMVGVQCLSALLAHQFNSTMTYHGNRTEFFWVITQQLVVIPTNISSPIFVGQELFGFFTLDDGTNRVSQTIVIV
jgi:hypothetical protein